MEMNKEWVKEQPQYLVNRLNYNNLTRTVKYIIAEYFKMDPDKTYDELFLMPTDQLIINHPLRWLIIHVHRLLIHDMKIPNPEILLNNLTRRKDVINTFKNIAYYHKTKYGIIVDLSGEDLLTINKDIIKYKEQEWRENLEQSIKNGRVL